MEKDARDERDDGRDFTDRELIEEARRHTEEGEAARAILIIESDCLIVPLGRE